MMTSNNFHADLAEGHVLERLAAGHLRKTFRDVLRSPASELFSGFDLMVMAGGCIPITYECKHDRMAVATGNVAFELYSTSADGTRRPSGLSSTSADFYVLGFRGIDQVYLINTFTIRQLLKDKGNWRRLDHAGDGQATLALFRMDFLLPHCHKFFKKSEING